MELPAPGGGSSASVVSDGYGGKVEAAVGLCWGCWRRSVGAESGDLCCCEDGEDMTRWS